MIMANVYLHLGCVTKLMTVEIVLMNAIAVRRCGASAGRAVPRTLPLGGCEVRFT